MMMGIVLVACLSARIAGFPRACHEHINSETDQLGREGRQALGPLFRKPPFNSDVLPLNPAKLPQSLPDDLTGVLCARSISAD